MTWYYAESGQQKGPVSDWDFSSLIRNGTIQPETLVWNENMTEWQTVRKVRPDLLAGPGAATIAGHAMPGQQKDLVVQQMREGVLPANAAAGLDAGPQYVGIWWRFLARIIDGFVAGAVACVIVMPFAFIMGLSNAAAHAHAHANQLKSEIFTEVMIQVISQGIGLSIACFYYTWMTGKFGATVGKMALGFKVVTADGGKVTYLRSFGRWAAEQLLCATISLVCVGLFGGVTFLMTGGAKIFKNGLPTSGDFPMAVVLGTALAASIGSIVGGFPWWMAGLDSEKRTLYDRICATRVIRK